MNKKIISLLVLVCVVIFAAACSSSDSNDKNDSETVGVAETTSPDTTADTTEAETTKSLTVVAGTAPKPETETEEITTEEVSTTAPITTKAPETTVAKTETITTEVPETTSSHKHTYSRKEQVDATCAKEGTVTFYCDCGASISNKLDKLPHQFCEATCVSAPVCTVCGATEGTPLPHDIKNGICSLCNNRVYRLGMSESELKAEIGEPSMTYTEDTVGGAVTSYVYCSDYKNLKIFQILDGNVVGAYITGKDFIFYYEPQNVTVTLSGVPEEKMEIISNKTIDVLSFTDIYGSKDVSAVWGKLSSFKYGFEAVSDRTVQGKLCMHITNHYRAINGASALVYSDKAESAARIHSVDMADNNYFEHSDLNGKGVGDRLRDEGLNVYCAENIQAGYFYINNHETGNIFFVTHGWYVSEGHRRNMLEPNYAYVGEATAHNPESKYHYYSTQVFYYE